jgi:transposase InsO family protein
MCELLGVSESRYWAWCRRPPSDRELSDAWLTERIRAIHSASGGRYGSPRVHAMLRREGIRVGEKRVARLMALAGLQGAHRRRRKGCTTGVEALSRSVTSSAAASARRRPTWCGRADKSGRLVSGKAGAACATEFSTSARDSSARAFTRWRKSGRGSSSRPPRNPAYANSGTRALAGVAGSFRPRHWHRRRRQLCFPGACLLAVMAGSSPVLAGTR